MLNNMLHLKHVLGKMLIHHHTKALTWTWQKTEMKYVPVVIERGGTVSWKYFTTGYFQIKMSTFPASTSLLLLSRSLSSCDFFTVASGKVFHSFHTFPCTVHTPTMQHTNNEHFALVTRVWFVLCKQKHQKEQPQ